MPDLKENACVMMTHCSALPVTKPVYFCCAVPAFPGAVDNQLTASSTSSNTDQRHALQFSQWPLCGVISPDCVLWFCYDGCRMLVKADVTSEWILSLLLGEKELGCQVTPS